VLNEAVGHRAPLHDLGYRARDTVEVFDELYARLQQRVHALADIAVA
jgi:hypothetical protein